MSFIIYLCIINYYLFIYLLLIIIYLCIINYYLFMYY